MSWTYVGAVLQISVEEIAGPTLVLSDGEVADPPTRVATIEDVVEVQGFAMDQQQAQKIVKQIKSMGLPQYITKLEPGRYRARVRVSYVIEPEPGEPFDAVPGSALP